MLHIARKRHGNQKSIWNEIVLAQLICSGRKKWRKISHDCGEKIAERFPKIKYSKNSEHNTTDGNCYLKNIYYLTTFYPELTEKQTNEDGNLTFTRLLRVVFSSQQRLNRPADNAVQ